MMGPKNTDLEETNGVRLEDYRPGAIGRIAQLHAEYYSVTHSFGLAFEAKVARELAEFLERRDPGRDLFKVAVINGAVEGSIAMDGSESCDKVAHLRWFILGDALRGLGLGRRMLDQALGFARQRGFASVYLWTLAGLPAAARLYADAGFEIVDESVGRQWGVAVTEQRLVLEFQGAD